VAQKRALIDMDHPKLSVSKQCELLDLSRASYYRIPGMETKKNQKLMRMIDEEYTRHPFLGSRGMKRYLRRQGHKVNRKRVQRLMRLMGLVSIAPQKRTTVSAPGHKIYPYLLRRMDVNRPGQVWCSDLTYIRLKRGFVFLTAVMDWHSRYVLSWEVSVTMDEGFCVSSLERALRQHPHPDIFNTDQGSQFTGAAFTGVLKDHKVKISMDGKGRATDNIMVERLWRTVKYEDVYIKDYETVEELTAGLRRYFQYYNHERSHQSLGDKTPAEIYWGRESLKRAA
jgi:putative transposase